ncbi:hypothetical protein RRG08_006203 [Elysia crispata]|uniref:Ig-like domain-containing protein n=1 Tax=Elysia crispata TaxID=231223 RepID=A0AAE0XYL6_9GAST|nr:hypothetical protein RRG08_006203 [Elysia crispata]
MGLFQLCSNVRNGEEFSDIVDHYGRNAFGNLQENRGYDQLCHFQEVQVMTIEMLLTVLVLLLCFCPKAEPACSPVEEGHSTRLTCEINTSSCPGNNYALTWKSKNNGFVAQCDGNGCGGRYITNRHFSATYTPMRSELTVNRAARSEGDPFNMETRWECHSCSILGVSVTACDKLQIYALPENPSCTVRKDVESGDIKSVTVSCSTSKVYPKARCNFYRVKDRGNSVQINNPVYSHTETAVSPVSISHVATISFVLEKVLYVYVSVA